MRLDRVGNHALELMVSPSKASYEDELRLMMCLSRVSEVKPLAVEYQGKRRLKKVDWISVTCRWEHQELAAVGAVMAFVREVTTGELTDLRIKPDSVGRIKKIAGRDWESIEDKAFPAG